MKFYRALSTCCLVAVLCVAAGEQALASGRSVASQSEKQKKPLLGGTASRDQRYLASVANQVRHELLLLPYYSVFDWLEGKVDAGGVVTLTGSVVRPSTKSDAEARVKSLESVSRVVNKIEVLPLSPNDDQLRVALYRAIFKYDSPLFRYGTAAVPSIHIIVANGRVQLKGLVANRADAQLAEVAANGVSGVFEVKNELQVEKSTD